MSKAKSKGSRYENEVVKLVQDYGLAANRVPMSGAIKGFDNDVVIGDLLRVETKYRKNGNGFISIIPWVEDSLNFVLISGNLAAARLSVALPFFRQVIDEKPDIEVQCSIKSNNRSFKVVESWLDQGDCPCDVLMCRIPRNEWLVIVRHDEGLIHFNNSPTKGLLKLV